MTVTEVTKTRGHVRVQWAVTILSNMSLLTYALQFGWISPIAKILQSDKSPTGRPLTDSEISWIASLPSLSGVAGVLILLQIVDRYGRKVFILILSTFQTKAATTLAFLRGLNIQDKEIQSEVDAMQKDDVYYKSMPDISIVTVFRTTEWRRAFLVMILIIFIHATNGSFSILGYAATLLSDSGVTISPELQNLSIPICMTVGSLITMSTIDRLGRKPILVTAFGVSAIAFTCIATSIMLKNNGWSTPGWLNVSMMMISVCCYGGGVSPIPFVVMPEIFNFQIRAKLMGYLVMMAWFMSFVQLIAFGALTSNYGAHVGFYMFVVINLLGVVITVMLLPETKGKRLEQIEKELREWKKKNIMLKLMMTL